MKPQLPIGVLYRDRKKQWRWRIEAANKHKLATSGEGYTKRSHAMAMLERAMEGFGCREYVVSGNGKG